MSSFNYQQSAANSNRFRSFTTTPNTQQQGIYSHPILSGSETDVSTSNENLSNEDRYVIRHTARQEPQGQENLQLQVHSNSNRNSQRESSSSYNTLIIHSLGEDTWNGHNSGTKDSPDNLSLYNAALGRPTDSNIMVGVYDSTSGATKRLSQGSNCSMSASNNSMSNRLSSGGGHNQVQEITDIPDDYLNESSVLKHLAKEATKSSVYFGTDQVVQNSTSDVIGTAADFSSSTNQSPQKQQQHFKHHAMHLLYNKSNCTPAPASTLNTQQQQQQQQQVYNRPSSAANTQRFTAGKNNLSKSQPDLSRIDLDDGALYNNNNNNSMASVATIQQPSPTIAMTTTPPQQHQQQQHYSAPVIMRNSSGGLYGGVGSGSGPRYRRDVSMPRPRTRGRDAALDMLAAGSGGSGEPFGRDKSGGGGGGNETWSADMIDMLLKENSALKLEVENCYARIGKSQKLEQEVLKVHSAHEDLVASCERRERLERTARTKLQLECRRLQDMNRLLRDQLDIQQVHLMAATVAANNNSSNNSGASSNSPQQQQQQQQSCGSDVSADDSAANMAALEYMRREMNKRDLLIAQFITQNKDLAATKERQEIELTAQRATLQEQRTHIDILEAALTNAQGNVVRLEDECRKKQAYVERVAQLQRALSAMQISNDRREQTEHNLRLQLELELELERTNNANGGVGVTNNNNNNSTAQSRGGVNSNGHVVDQQQQQAIHGDDIVVVGDLRRQLREREEKLMRMEGECSKWEQRYLDESAVRQAAIDAATIPKDAKIAALEQTSEETEKIIAEARTDKIRHMDKAHVAQKKLADLESRMKDLESKVAERDAMIRVLNQKHTHTHSHGHAHTPHYTPTSHHHSPGHPATNSAATTATGTDLSHHHHHHHHVLSSREELVSSVLTSACNSYSGSDSSFAASLQAVVAAGGYAGSTGGSSSGSAGFDATKKTLDSQIKEIDSQLDTQMLTKRALCCFPGFTNPIAAARKGKLPKPLLASLVQQRSSPPLTNTNKKQANIAPGITPDAALLYGAMDTSSSLLLLPCSTSISTSTSSSSNTTEILLLEKQGRCSQQQRMSDSSNLPPSSLPRPPPRTITYPSSIAPTNHRSHQTSLRYNRLNSDDNSSTGSATSRRKKSDGGDSIASMTMTCQVNARTSPRSMIPSPATNRSRLEYSRLVASESANGSTVSLRKTDRASSTSSCSPRVTRFGCLLDRDSTFSDNSASSLPVTGGGGGGGGNKVRFYSGPSVGGGNGGGGAIVARRGSSLGKDSKSNCSDGVDSIPPPGTHPNQYRIQF